MNKNNKNKKESFQDRSGDIITKKGFLISLPGKKKSANDSSASIINRAQTKNDEILDGKNKQKNTHTESFNKNNKPNHNNKSNKHNNQNNQNNKKNKGNFENKNVPQNRDDKKGKFKGDDKNNTSPFENKNRFEKHGKNFKNKNRHDRRDRKDKNLQGVKNEKNEHTTKQNAFQSPLSADMMSSKRDNVVSRQTKGAQGFSAEKTLEEKYANMPTLAEQIAAEEQRNKNLITPKQTDDENCTEIVGVRFREAGKIYYFDPDGKKIDFATPVIVETSRGVEYGFTAISNRFVPTEGLVSPLKPIQRIATKEDTQKYLANKALEESAAQTFKEKVSKLGLEMHLIYVEYTFDNSKLLFYFSAESRVDFRELVKELASVFRTRIELRQIGVRDEAKTLGGLGNCGRCTCCSTFLGDFAQVSIKMAKDQSLSLNVAKISGACGKLMCCLRYEDKVYEEENKRTPGINAIVQTPEGNGIVVERNALKGIVKVLLDQAKEALPKEFKSGDVTVKGYKKTENAVEEISDELKAAEE